MPEACPECGTGLVADAEFCDSCGVYVGWDQTMVGMRRIAADAPPPVEPAPAGAGAQRRPEPRPAETPRPAPVTRGMVVRASATEVDVQPGGSTTVELTIRNTGSVVEQYDVRVDGEAAGFATVTAPQLQVYPGNEAVTQVVFAPARAVQPYAGPHRWRIDVTSTVSHETQHVDGTILVAGFADVVATLDPTRTKGSRTTFTHALRLENRGNSLAQVFVTPDDPTREIAFPQGARSVALAAGQVLTEAITGTTKRTWFGATQSLPFVVSLRSTPGGDQPVNGTRLQRAVIPRWVPPALLVLAAIAVAAVLYLTGSETTGVPSVVGDRVSEAVADIEAKELEAELVPRVSDKPEGEVLETDPAAGSEIELHETVKVFYSSGEEGDGRVVPTLRGRSAAEAEAKLRALGLEPIVVEEVDQLAEGLVIGTEPAANEQLKVGSEVTLRVSLGPDGGGGDTATIPRVTDLSPQQAKQTLEGEGFTDVSLRFEFDDSVAAGQVIGTDPEAGEEASFAQPVAVLVSRGRLVRDLAETAEGAVWLVTTEGLSLEPLDFGDRSDEARGFVELTSEELEDGSDATDDLLMHPPEFAGGQIVGEFTLDEPLAEGDRLAFAIGFLADHPGSVGFSVVAVMPDSSEVELLVETAGGANGELGRYRGEDAVALDTAAGATVLKLLVDAGDAAESDSVVWVDPVVIGPPE